MNEMSEEEENEQPKRQIVWIFLFQKCNCLYAALGKKRKHLKSAIYTPTFFVSVMEIR